MTEESGRRSLLDPALLRDLLRRLESTDIDELEVSDGASRLYLRREPRQVFVAQQTPSLPVAQHPSDRIPIVAPLTGVYYSRSAPDQPPFATVGESLHAGEVVALIETMKLFNEVLTETSGTVIDIVARDGDLVEAGSPLLYLVPIEEGD